jgi:poly-gamma-glutamate synthesis protein (capsule biosynthesis protein)
MPSPEPVNNRVSIIFAGDVMLGRSVMGAALDEGDFFYPFRKTADFLKDADLTMVNLENPIVKDCPRHKGGFKFCTSYQIAEGLKFAGIDIVSLANNHTNNYGEAGLEDTKRYLTENNIDYVGDLPAQAGDNLLIKEIKGIKFGFLGFNYTFSTNSLEDDIELVKKYDTTADILIVNNHWGEEYKDIANSFQTTAARRMVDNGADVIIGHHPHWVQNFEEYSGKPIYYSLGNFIFDQMWSEETKKGLVVKMTFDPPSGEAGAKLIKREEFKTYIPKIGQPEILR